MLLYFVQYEYYVLYITNNILFSFPNSLGIKAFSALGYHSHSHLSVFKQNNRDSHYRSTMITL